MSSRLEQAIERLSVAVEHLEQSRRLGEGLPEVDNASLKSEIVEIRGLVDAALSLLAERGGGGSS